MKNSERIDFENIEDDAGSNHVSKKNPRKLNPDTVSHEGVASAFSAPHIDSLSPEEILILREEGKLPESDSNLVTGERHTDEIKPQSDFHHEVLEKKDLELIGEEMLRALKDKEEKEEVVPGGRASITSKKKYDSPHTRTSHGKPKGKYKKGSETIRGRMN